MKKLLTGIFIFGFVLLASAQDINNYKYIIIPESFEFTDGIDQYRLNTLTKFLFEQNGYNTLMKTEDKPVELKRDGCLALHTELQNNSGLFVTKLVLKLLDCNDRVVFETKEGRSREKDFQASYQEALRDAFTSFEEVEYNYTDENAKIPQVEVVVVPAVAVESVKEEVEMDKDEEEAKVEKITEEDTVEEIEVEKENNDSNREFSYSGKNYNLKETAQGLGLFQESSSEPIAILIETNEGKSYIYNSLTNQGVAYFDSTGNLIVEYFNKQENKKITITYELED